MSEEQTASRDLIAIARRNAERADSVLQKRLARTARNEAIAADYNGGNGLKVSNLAKKHGVSEETVRKGLRDLGVYTASARKRLTDEVKTDVVTQLEARVPVATVAQSVGISIASVRSIGLAAGVLVKGARRQRRTEQEWSAIKTLDDGCREQFGVGLLSLGNALRTRERAAQPVKPLAEQVSPPLPVDEDKPW